jgi:hypothetical protein
MQITRKKVAIAVTAAVIAAIGILAGCTSLPSAQQAAVNRSQTRANYVPKNDVEGRNYNARQRLADDPTAIVWCSVYPNNQTVKPYTVPIAGKLTSGNKRPYPTSQFSNGTNDNTNSPELPGTDGFYGSSSDYSYGFDPAGVYWEFHNADFTCTSSPTLIQKNSTTFSVTTAPDQLTSADLRAEAALKACRATNPDPSAPCPAAAQILGIKP